MLPERITYSHYSAEECVGRTVEMRALLACSAARGSDGGGNEGARAARAAVEGLVSGHVMMREMLTPAADEMIDEQLNRVQQSRSSVGATRDFPATVKDAVNEVGSKRLTKSS